ncbi:helix-turn-helix transcriptional regulator [Anditalea andensis]|uniref:Transcriptional regulator n=1 Tax=Anditalea andensis TaxID=1048983 RepID=A0A074L3V4_9BACT|nr:WYL domain-containing protein [Anditalea andensis]KEO75884.1 transcriptional regulator [Anditalea andensis]
MAKENQIEQQKILRVFKLINLLKTNAGKSVKRLGESLDTDPRTVYRYFNLLEALGFQIEKQFGKFRIVDRTDSLTDSFYGTFTEEESAFLAQAISKSGKKNLLKESILKKVIARSPLELGAQRIFNAKLGVFVDELAEAVKRKYQVVLIDYYSLNSDSEKNRRIEPVGFSKDYEYIHAFEVETKSMKKFKLERISELEVTSKKHQYESLHIGYGDEFFGFSGTAKYHVKLKLSKKAYQLLIEEYPEARPFTTTAHRQFYYFEHDIAEFPGISRFILGLPGEVQVMEGDELKAFLNEQLTKQRF